MRNFLVTTVSDGAFSEERPIFGIVPATVNQAVKKRLCNKSILIIDDDAGMLRALDKVLTGEGALVSCSRVGGKHDGNFDRPTKSRGSPDHRFAHAVCPLA